jgi:hypothetical protein
VCQRNYRYLVVDFAHACRDAHPAFWKIVFQRWILSGGMGDVHVRLCQKGFFGTFWSAAGERRAK